MRPGPVLDALEPVPDDGGELIGAAGGEIAQAIPHVMVRGGD
jgi:hypothetical protein